MNGILHLGGTKRADIDLIVQATLTLAMAAGVICARRKLYRIHGILEASVVLVNSVMIGVFMLPSFPRHLWRKGPAVLSHPRVAVVVIHGMLGGMAECLGLYTVLSAGTRLLPERLRIQNYKRWMRVTLLLWWMALLAGGVVYYVWYVGASGH